MSAPTFDCGGVFGSFTRLLSYHPYTYRSVLPNAVWYDSSRWLDEESRGYRAWSTLVCAEHKEVASIHSLGPDWIIRVEALNGITDTLRQREQIPWVGVNPSIPVKEFVLLLSMKLGIMGVITPYADGPSPIYANSAYLPAKRLGTMFGATFLILFLANRRALGITEEKGEATPESGYHRWALAGFLLPST